MKPDEFVNAIVESAYKGAIGSELSRLENPPGRQPRPELMRLSNWYLSLTPTERDLAQQLIRASADSAIFGFLALIDGVRTLDDRKSKIVVLVEGENVGVNGDLHEIFRSIVDEEEYPSIGE